MCVWFHASKIILINQLYCSIGDFILHSLWNTHTYTHLNWIEKKSEFKLKKTRDWPKHNKIVWLLWLLLYLEEINNTFQFWIDFFFVLFCSVATSGKIVRNPRRSLFDSIDDWIQISSHQSLFDCCLLLAMLHLSYSSGSRAPKKKESVIFSTMIFFSLEKIFFFQLFFCRWII